MQSDSAILKGALDSLNVVDVAGLMRKYNVRMQPNGINYYADCPFPSHDFPRRKGKPCFKLFVESNYFKCFSCLVEGGPITLTIRLLGYQAALTFFGSRFGIKTDGPVSVETVNRTLQEELNRCDPGADISKLLSCQPLTTLSDLDDYTLPLF